MGFLDRLLNTLIDPNLISLLFLAGIAGIGFEIFHPGVVLPGALGAVALVIALFGFSVLPFSWGGILLILLGVFLFIADAHVTSHGALTAAGLISLAAGMLLLFHNAPAPYKTSFPLVISIAVVLGLFWAFLIAKAVRAKRQPVRVGRAADDRRDRRGARRSRLRRRRALAGAHRRRRAAPRRRRGSHRRDGTASS